MVIEENQVSTNIFSKVFMWMFMGLFATGLISYFTYTSGFGEQILSGGAFKLLMIVELAVVIIFSLCFRKLSPTVVAVLYFVYAVINGITLSTIYYVFSMQSILIVLFASAALFLVFAFLGMVLKKDLSSIGTLLIGALIIALIVSVINMFIGNTIIDTAIDWIVLVVFFGITAWDIQKIKNMGALEDVDNEKIHIYGAMMIYLDFINIFLRLLSIFGKRK